MSAMHYLENDVQIETCVKACLNFQILSELVYTQYYFIP